MGFGNAFTKSNKSTTNNSTTNNYTDESANAGGDNSLAVGSGATVVFNDLSEGVARDAIAAGVNQTDKTLDTAARLTEFTVNTIKGLSETSARENADVRNAAQTSLETNAGLLSALQEQTSDALAKAQSPEAESIATILKPILYVAGGIAAVVALLVFSRKKK